MSRERERFDDIGKRIKREIDASSPSPNNYSNCSNNSSQIRLDQMGRRHMLGHTGTTLNTITPCAACKLLRRRCAEECPFSPYFAPHEPQKFAAVHKVFGASNVSKMLMEVPESQRADAANSLVYEANVRLRDPVYGCMGAISALQQRVQSLQAELNAVRAEILKYKYREAANTLLSSTHHHPPNLVTSVAAAVALRPPPQPQTTAPTPPPPPPPTTPPPPSIVVSTSLYTSPSTTPGFSSNISSDSVPYFD
ncbi:LOB domain-containing protein 15 [Ancistrocladus abbreviatus]